MNRQLITITAALCLAASVAHGQEQPQMPIALPAACEFSSELGRFLTVAEIEANDGPRVVQDIIPDTMQTGLAYFEVEDLHGAGDGSKWLVLRSTVRPRRACWCGSMRMARRCAAGCGT